LAGLVIVWWISTKVTGTIWIIVKQECKTRPRKLSYDKWYDVVEDEINIELAESGADRELDFDSEKEFEARYQKYLRNK